MYPCLYAHVCIVTYICICISIRIWACMCICIMYVYVCMYVCMYMYLGWIYVLMIIHCLRAWSCILAHGGSLYWVFILSLLFLFAGTTPTCLRVAPLLASRFIRLQQVEATTSRVVCLPDAALHINTPLVVSRWVVALACHPNRVWVDHLIQGLTPGVRIGFNPAFSCQSSRSNMATTAFHPEVVQRYLDTEVAAGNREIKILNYA